LSVTATPASAAYTRVSSVPADDELALAGESVIVGSTPQGGRSSLTVNGLDGTIRPVALPSPAGLIEEVDGSRSALAVITIPSDGGRLQAFFGRQGERLRRLPRPWVDVAVSGDRIVSLHDRAGNRPARLEVRDLGTGQRRRIRLRESGTGVVTAAGHYAAYLARLGSARREHVTVVDLHTGRERYRTTPLGDVSTYGLAPDGRLWFVKAARRSGRVLTATPRRPRPRTVARLPLQPYALAVTRTSVAVVGDARHERGRVELIRRDGTRRAVTPTVPAAGAIAYDGRTLAFTTGSCVFAGPPPPATTPSALDLTGCQRAPAEP
jgi:hypothetical protein